MTLLLEKARSYFSRKRAIKVNIHFPWNRFWMLSQCEQTQSCCLAVRAASVLLLLLAQQVSVCPCYCLLQALDRAFVLASYGGLKKKIPWKEDLFWNDSYKFSEILVSAWQKPSVWCTKSSGIASCVFSQACLGKTLDSGWVGKTWISLFLNTLQPSPPGIAWMLSYEDTCAAWILLPLQSLLWSLMTSWHQTVHQRWTGGQFLLSTSALPCLFSSLDAVCLHWRDCRYPHSIWAMWLGEKTLDGINLDIFGLLTSLLSKSRFCRVEAGVRVWDCQSICKMGTSCF